MKKNELIEKGRSIKSELYSRRNASNGKYNACGLFYLVNLGEVKNTDIFFLESLQVRADSADKIIAEAELQGRNTNDSQVLKELGEQINSLGTLIHRNVSIMTAVFVSLKIIILYAVSITIWTLIFRGNIWIYLLIGFGVGSVISLLFVAPVIATKRTKEHIKEIVFSVGATIGVFGIVIGIIGLGIWIIKLIFFSI